MENKMVKKILSTIIIIALAVGITTLPIIDDSHQAEAAEKKITIKFNPNGGKFIKQTIKKSNGKKKKAYLKKKKVIKGKKYKTLAKVKRDGYKFKGWYTKKKGGKKITAKSKVRVKKTQTLYARWISTAKWPVGEKAIDARYRNALSKTRSQINDLTKYKETITHNNKKYEAYLDSDEVMYLFENGKCIAIDGKSLMPQIPEKGYPLSEIKKAYGKDRISDSGDFKTYHEFKIGGVYTVMEFEENHMQVQPWVSIGYYKDEDLIVLRSMISADK